MTFKIMSILWLTLLAPVALAFFIWREHRRTSLGQRFVNERLRSGSNQLRSLRPWTLALALLGLVVALAGPYSGYRTVPVVARETNRILVMDVSNSMAAEDVGTSRLSAAKALAIRLAEEHQGRVALAVFEAVPEVVSPLTSDSQAVAALIDTIEPGETGQPGSDVGSAIVAALQLIESDPAQKADLVVLSDGEDQGARVNEAITRARQLGVEISTIVVGSATGASIPTSNGPMRDETGERVTTYARTEVLSEIASRTGGKALQNPFGERALEPLLRYGRGATARQTEMRIPLERYQWPLAFAFIALLGASMLHRGAE